MKYLHIQQQVSDIPDVKAAIGLVATGGGGSFIQALTEYANLFVAFGNGFLIICGAFLMYQKYKSAKSVATGGQREEDIPDA